MLNYTLFLDGEIFSDYLYHYEEKAVYTYSRINKIDGGTLQIHHILDKLPKNNYNYSIYYLGYNICSSHSNIRKYPIIKNNDCNNCDINCCKNKEIWRINSFLGIDELGKCYESDKKNITDIILYNNLSQDIIKKSNDNTSFFIINDTGNTDIDKKHFLNYCRVKNSEIIFLTSNPSFYDDSRNDKKNNFLRAYIDFFEYKKGNKNYLHKTIYITNIEELRDAGANIKKFLSWEQISQEVLWHIEFDKKFNFLTNFLMIIVRIDFEGVIVIYPKKEPFDAYLFFDPNSIEGNFKTKIPGMMKMSSTFFMTSMAHFFMDKNYKRENVIFKR